MKGICACVEDMISRLFCNCTFLFCCRCTISVGCFPYIKHAPMYCCIISHDQSHPYHKLKLCRAMRAVLMREAMTKYQAGEHEV